MGSLFYLGLDENASFHRPFSNLPKYSFLSLQNFGQASFSICLKSQEKLKTMLMQNFGGTKKSLMAEAHDYGEFENGLLPPFQFEMA